MSKIIDGQEYYDENFKDVRLEPDQILTATFADCAFINCSFASAILRNCRFNNCVFKNCDLSLAKISGSSFPSTSFESSKLIGIDWTQGDWSKLRFGNLLGFSECVLNHSTFIGVDLSGIQIKDCIATGVDFREANLSKVAFGTTDLAESIFGNTNLSKADLRHARNYSIDPAKNNLERAKFSMPEAIALLYSMDIELDEND